MRFLVLTHNYPTHWNPSAGIFVQDMNEVLERAGHKVVIGVLSLSKFKLVLICRMLSLVFRGFCWSGRFDKIIAHWWIPGGLIGYVLARVTGKPLILHIHGTDAMLIGKSKVTIWLWNVVSRRAESICFVSRFLRDRCLSYSRPSLWEKLTGALSSTPRFHVLPMPVNGAIFNPKPLE